MKRALPLLLIAACSGAADELVAVEQHADATDRMLLGEAAKYPADPELRARTTVLDASMTERRKAAWAIVERVVAPTALAADGVRLPRFQTWYTGEEVWPMFDRLFRALPEADKKARAPFTAAAIAEIFPWSATRAPSLASFSAERLAERRKDLASSGGAASLNVSRTLLSPDYVAHLLASYGVITNCTDPNADTFAPCLAGEFPTEAAAVKARWISGTDPLPTYDTSPRALSAKLASGTFGDGDGTANPGAEQIYSMKVADSTKRLVALHIATKELRDWAWITLWWSDSPDTDFGADRPASLQGAFANYKMCVVTAYEESDHAPTWCSNPYIESEEHAANTNCIGCHQHGGTGETSLSILGAPDQFPQSSRKKIRSTFPADYAFTTVGGLDLAHEMQTRISSALGEL